jgi:Na+/proline symporter
MPSALLLVVVPGLLVLARGFAGVLVAHLSAALVLVLAFVSCIVGGVPGWFAGSMTIPEIEPLSSSFVAAGSVVLGLWLVCADQPVIHHLLAVRDQRSVRKGATFAAVVVVLALAFAALMPAESLRTTRGDAGMDLSSLLVGVAVLGVCIAALASQFLAVSLISGTEMFPFFRPGGDDGSKVLFSRLALTVVVIIAILAGTSVGLIGADRVDWLLRALAVFAPPVVAVVLVGSLWQRLNGRGALWGLVLGWLTGGTHALISSEVSGLLVGLIVTFVVSVTAFVLVSLAVTSIPFFPGLAGRMTRTK